MNIRQEEQSAARPAQATEDKAIPLPYFDKGKLVVEGSSEFELDDDKDGLFLGDNVPLFMKLRESERNRRSKMKEASLKMPRPDIERDLCNAEGFFGPGLLNPFSSHDKDLNDDFLMKDFENLLKRKP